jgi:glycosyltransferase involved in cell wall biosynthesis
MIKPARILIFIPAYRCATQISRVLKQIDSTVQAMVDTVLVVDNRSPDETQVEAIRGSRELKFCNSVVWENAGNYGLGGSHKVAFQYAIANSFDYVVVLHGDDQGDIHDALPILASLRSGEPKWDCMLGARFHPYSRINGYSKFRTCGNIVYNWIFSLATGTRIYDLGSGLNIYKVRAMRSLDIALLPDDLTFNYGLLLASISRGHVVEFFPISWREVDQVSNVKLFSQAVRVLKILLKYLSTRTSFPCLDLRAAPRDWYGGEVVARSEAATISELQRK